MRVRAAVCGGCAGGKPAKKKFKSYSIGYFHIDVAEVRTERGKLNMFVATDRTSNFAFVELHEFTTPGAGGSAMPLISETIAGKLLPNAALLTHRCNLAAKFLAPEKRHSPLGEVVRSCSARMG
ncbi:hypothetical protein A9K65_021460 [Mesorhizobium sp. WSM1497]|nr:hypothetical protein A9K65_021460 [Mesorhizobium sp. WSM1497]